MGKWSTFLVSLIPAGLAGYLCYLLATIGLTVPDDKMGMMFWGPLGAGFLGCVMAILTPFGIAIFVRSAPKATPSERNDEQDFAEGDYVDDDFAEDLDDSDFESDEFANQSSTDFQTAELDSSEFEDEDYEDDLSGEFDSFDDDEEDYMA